MHVRRFEWDVANVDHIARHALEPPDVEAACRADALILRGRQGCYLAYGRTAAGRYILTVLRSLGGGVVRVITSRDMTSRERQFYQERRR